MPRHPGGAHGDGPSAPTDGAARGAAAVLAVQAVCLAVGSVVLAFSAFAPDTFDVVGAEVLALIGLATAAGLGYLARAVDRTEPWARGPVLVVELICLPIAWTVIQNDKLLPGLALGASALAVLVLAGRSGLLTRD